MKEPKIEIKYQLPEINTKLNKNKLKKLNEPMDKLFNQFENIEANYYNSQILSEISKSRMKNYQQQSSIMNSSLMIHNGIKCEKCQTLPLMGHRYKCPKCLNYNLCEECEQLNSETFFHPHNNFVLIRIPENAPMNTGYSFECITTNLEIHREFGIDSFEFSITLLNSGNQTWPECNCILKCKKEISTIFCMNCLVPPIDTNETVDIKLLFDKCNKIPRGEYLCYLQLFIKNKVIRGPIKIKVFIE